jgi:multisubunit Na+/H+ antiporter MnhG subunit
MAIKILAFILVILGAIVSYGAGFIVDRLKLSQRVKVADAEMFDAEGLEKYKRMKAMSIVKLMGLVVLLPGVILVFIAYR